jgi:predicted NAD-dependent protein-ADP-ribosyltransferase YbiA (DUF1768 family)
MSTPVITFTKVRLPNGWLGNMAPFPVKHEDLVYPTTEALFQALRFDDKGIREAIRSHKSPMAAKMTAKANANRMVVTRLSNLDIDNMRLCLKLKLEQHPALVPLLLETKQATIVEDASSRRGGSALFWGAAKVGETWVGENQLGKLWMERRIALKEIHEYDEGLGRGPW